MFTQTAKVQSAGCLADTRKTIPPQAWQSFHVCTKSMLMLTTKMLLQKLPCSQCSELIQPTNQSYSETYTLVQGVVRTTCMLTAQGIQVHVPPAQAPAPLQLGLPSGDSSPSLTMSLFLQISHALHSAFCKRTHSTTYTKMAPAPLQTQA